MSNQILTISYTETEISFQLNNDKKIVKVPQQRTIKIAKDLASEVIQLLIDYKNKGVRIVNDFIATGDSIDSHIQSWELSRDSY